MDVIFIRELRVETIVGINDWEREVRQTVIVDLELAVDVRTASAAEDIRCTLDYHSISEQLAEFIAESRFYLIEALAEHSAAFLRQEFNVPWLRMRLTKPDALPNAGGAGVIIERGRRPAHHSD